MKKLFARRPSASMLVALTALFVALGGTSLAAILITGANVKDGSLRGRDIANGSVGGADVIDGSLRGRDITNGSVGGADMINDKVTGKQVNESTLGTVPSAATAGGVTPKRFSVKIATAGPEQQILDLGGMQIFASCPGGVPNVRATTTAAGSSIVAENVSPANRATGVRNPNFSPGQSVDLDQANQGGSGTISFVQASGTSVSAIYGFDRAPVGTFAGCVVSGTAFGG